LQEEQLLRGVEFSLAQGNYTRIKLHVRGVRHEVAHIDRHLITAESLGAAASAG
jgi:hypothetical protein